MLRLPLLLTVDDSLSNDCEDHKNGEGICQCQHNIVHLSCGLIAHQEGIDKLTVLLKDVDQTLP